MEGRYNDGKTLTQFDDEFSGGYLQLGLSYFKLNWNMNFKNKECMIKNFDR